MLDSYLIHPLTAVIFLVKEECHLTAVDIVLGSIFWPLVVVAVGAKGLVESAKAGRF